MRLTWQQVSDALRQSSLRWLLPLNFIFVPILNFALIRIFHVPAGVATGILLLAASPFAPVVPIFARMSRADLALAAALTALFPFACAFLTPLVCKLSIRAVGGDQSLQFSAGLILLILFTTITLPMSLGLLIRHGLPKFSQTILRPMEILSEAAGAISLIFVTVVEFKSILQTGGMNLLAMALAFEINLWLGYALTGPTRSIRRVGAVGTSNRNIALALLIAVQSFPNTPIAAAVVANGLLLIALGLVHVGWWRFLGID
jgi:BASS family bile acid:Na+ symporter